MNYYKLIKLYPNSQQLGFISEPIIDNVEKQAEYYLPEFWEKNKAISEEGKPIFDDTRIYFVPDSKFSNKVYESLAVNLCCSCVTMKYFTQRANAEKYLQSLKKDYEILSFVAIDGSGLSNKKDNGKFSHNDYQGYWSETSMIEDDEYKIHSVKRLSDNQVFTLGDKYTHTFNPSVRVLERINLIRDKIYFSMNNESIEQSQLANIIKCNPIFTTSDGVDVYEGDEFYAITSIESNIVSKFTCTGNTRYGVDYKRFSIRELAQKYLNSLKPKFKVGDFVMTQNYGVKKVEKVCHSIIHCSDNILIDFDMTSLCLATLPEIKSWYESQGWVKGRKFIITTLAYEIVDLYVEEDKIILLTKNNACNEFTLHTLEGGYDEQIKLLPQLPKSWEELGDLVGYTNKTVTGKGLFSTKSQAKSALAFAQLSQLAKVMNGDWKQNLDNAQYNWTIIRNRDELKVDSYSRIFNHITFATKELAEFSLLHHRELWEQYYQM